MDDLSPIDLTRIADEVGVSPEQVVNVTALLDAGNTVPFITRYRKEQTGNLDEEQIRQISERVHSARQLAERAQTILRLIDAQDKLTPELREAILKADTLKRLEDLYLPYRPKRRSRAQQARERGLEPLAERIWNQDSALADLQQAAAEFVDPERELNNTDEVLQGAADILAERIGEDADLREQTRTIAWRTGRLVVSGTKAGQADGQEYRDYFDFSEAISKIPPHRILALNRGEKANALRVKFTWDDEQARAAVKRHFGFTQHRFSDFLELCANDALNRLIQPSLERELRRESTERAEAHAVGVFAKNLKNLLLQPPLRGERVLAIDPGFRTGCKVAILDERGQCFATDVIYVTGSAEKREAARQKLAELLQQHATRLVAIGNGTACRETEELISELIAEEEADLRYVIVNEAGASIYSTSNVAREEFPDYDATIRGTISIGRRLQDPLSELVKIDPQHIGVGMYQHDVSPKMLKESLDQVIESCVNYVGVDLNTASASLLRHVSGLNQLIARRVVEWRERQGGFRSRQQLLDVPGIGEATFTQAAGFLKISGGDNPLDSTWIHPESYAAAQKLLDRLQWDPGTLTAQNGGTASGIQDRLSELDRSGLSQELGVGTPTLNDIIDDLCRPGRDPRTDLPGPLFKQGVLKLEDLVEEMELTGTVLNVVDFGVFVDIGLKDSGLVHISQMANRFISSPHELVAVGDVITVWVLGVDRDRRRVSLTMIKPGTTRSGESSAPARSGNRSSRGSASAEGAAPKEGNRSTTGPRKPRKRTASRREQSGSAAPALTDDHLSGREPLRGFDELKQLWKNRKN